MKKPFGQHFLFDRNILRKIIQCSGISPEDTVVEIGPGLGPLTRLLSEQAKRVVAIEFDKKLITRLKDNLTGHTNIDIVTADALKFPYETIRGRFRVVSNIPYNITTPIIFKLLEYKEKIQDMTLLMQKEVAKRITALPNTREYGVLSISTQLYTKPVLKFTVSRKAFSPPPDVDSAVVYFEVFPSPLVAVHDETLLLKIVKTAFSRRRKTIINGLRDITHIKEALAEARIDHRLRPENLSIEEFARLADALHG